MVSRNVYRRLIRSLIEPVLLWEGYLVGTFLVRCGGGQTVGEGGGVEKGRGGLEMVESVTVLRGNRGQW